MCSLWRSVRRSVSDAFRPQCAGRFRIHKKLDEIQGDAGLVELLANLLQSTGRFH